MKKIIAVVIMILAGIMLSACGGSGDSAPESETKPSRDGFDVSKNQEIEYCGYSFAVPDYCEFEEGEDGDLQTMLEDNRGMILFQNVDSELSEDEFSSSKSDLIKEWNEKIECETVDDDGSFTTTNDSGTKLTGKSTMLFNSDQGKLIVAVLYQSENAEYDYMSDFDAIVNSARKVGNSDNSGQSESNDNSSSTGDRAETDISPEFKETMDSYEAFFDEYVEFMQKYNENPSDTELLLELSSMMTKEADMLKKLDEMDESEMTTAEAAYYLEVTARINAKLASVQ